MKSLIVSLLFSFTAIAGLPPTSSKGTADTSYVTTFKTNYGTIPVTHVGSTATIGIIPVTAGGTGSATRNYVLLAGDTMTGDLTVANTIRITKGTGSGVNNLFLGPNSGTSTTTGHSNTGVGDQAAGRVTGGASVTAVGHQALGFATTGDASTAVGAMAGRNQTTGGANNYFGVNAGFTSSTGGWNSCFGNGCLYNNTGNYNSAFGFESGVQSTGNGNLFLGYRAGYNQVGAVSNKLWIANNENAGAAGSNLITGDFANGKVGINVDPGSIASSAAFQIVSTTGTFIPPKQTTTQQNAISTPDTGSIIYNTSTSKPTYYDGAWRGLVDNSSSETIAGTKTFSSTISGSINGNASTVTTNANLTGMVTSVGNAATVVTNANLTGDITSVGNATSYSTTVPLNKGGTGQTTKAAAFDALSPMTTLGDIVYGGTSGTGTRLPASASGTVLTSNGVGVAPSWQTPTPGAAATVKIATIADLKTQGTAGGSAQSSFATRNLNTIISDPSSIVSSLSGDVITLPAGTYSVSGSAPCYHCTNHKTRLMNLTTNSVLLEGSSEYTSSTQDIMTRSWVNGGFVLAAPSKIILMHYATNAFATSGWGTAVALGVASESYSTITIEKL